MRMWKINAGRGAEFFDYFMAHSCVALGFGEVGDVSRYQEIESLRADTLNVLRATMQRLERSVIEMDAELLRPQGINITEMEKSTEVTHIESSLSDLQKQLLDLKRELQGVK